MIEAMPASVLARIRSDRAAWPGVPAGAAEAEADAAEHVSSDDVVVLNTEGDTFYGHGVKRHVENVDGLSYGRIDTCCSCGVLAASPL